MAWEAWVQSVCEPQGHSPAFSRAVGVDLPRVWESVPLDGDLREGKARIWPSFLVYFLAQRWDKSATLRSDSVRPRTFFPHMGLRSLGGVPPCLILCIRVSVSVWVRVRVRASGTIL